MLYKEKENVTLGQQHDYSNINMNNCKDMYRKMILKTFKCKKLWINHLSNKNT